MNYLYRLQARKTMKAHLKVLLLLGLIAQAFGVVAQVAVALIDMNTEKYILNLIQPDSGAYDVAAALKEIKLMKAGKELLLTAVTALLSIPLEMGFYRGCLAALRGQNPKVRMSLAFLPKTLKCIGLYLLKDLLVLVWMLPGILLWGGTEWLLKIQYMPEQTVLWTTLRAMGLIVMYILAVYSGIRYSMSLYILADDPDARLRDCICGSVAMLKGYKIEMLFLQLSFLGWNVLATSIGLPLSFFLGDAIGGVLKMPIDLVLNMYIMLAYLAMYDNIRPGGAHLTEHKYLNAMNEQARAGMSEPEGPADVA